ncbi:MAG TPA: hypothetical protein VGM29_18670 [Polyangiaceae bacterium]|jgi:hypothetical protein
MNPFLVFVACLAGLVLVAFIVSRITGARAAYIESFTLEAGERVLWEDPLADAYPIPIRRALITSYRRSRRWVVRVTDRRIIVGCKALFSAKHMIMHVLYPSDRAFPDEANHVGGGLLTRGYQTFVFERASMARTSSNPNAFVDVSLSAALPSSTNLSAFRIYSDRLESFCLPE